MQKIKDQVFRLVPKGTFARHVATLMSGTVLAGTIAAIVVPILTRIYTPQDFGIFALYSSLLGLLSAVVCGRYELAIILPENDRDAANLLLLSIVISLCVCVLILLLVSFFRVLFAQLLGTSELAVWLWLLPLSLFASGLFKTLNFWSTRRNHFKRLAARQIAQSGITAVAQIGAGTLCASASASGLIGGSIVGQLAAVGKLAWQIESDEGKFIRQSLDLSRFRRVAKRYKQFPLFDIWSGLLNTASTMLPTLLLGYFFNPAIVGFYALGYQVLSVPVGIVGTSIAQVFFPRANDAKRTGTIDKITLEIFKRLLGIGFAPILLLTIIAPDLFALIFGSRWFSAGEYLRWMSVWLLFVFISSPLSNIYSIMEKQREGLVVNFVMFCSRLIVLVIGGIRKDAVFTIAAFGVTGAILWIFNCIYIQHLAGISVINTLITIVKEFFYGIPYALFPILVYFATHNSFMFVVAGVGAGAIFLIVQAYRMWKTGQFA